MAERQAVSAVMTGNGWLDETLAIAIAASDNRQKAVTRMDVPREIPDRPGSP